MQIEKGLAATLTSESRSVERSQTVTDKTPDPEVKEKARRRQYSAAYKLRILEQLDHCSKPGEVGALLRREGLYSSNIIKWRKQLEAGKLKALSPNKRGRLQPDPQAAELARLRRENQGLKQKLEQAELIIEYQKKVAALLGFNPTTGKGEDS